MKNLPLMGLGTFIGIEVDYIADDQQRKAMVKDTILQALAIGYRHLDLAESYNNLDAIGEALQQAMQPVPQGGLGIKREELWLTLKSDNYSKDAIQNYLKELQVDYLDTFIVHHPFNNHVFGSEATLYNTWKEVTAIPHDLVKNFGISNCYKGHISRLIDVCKKYKLPKPFSNEIESNLMCPNQETIEYCQKNGIHVIGYSPLGYNFAPIILEAEVLTEVATRIQATPAQIALAWHMARGVAVIPKSTKAAHLHENFAATAYIASIDTEQQQKLSTLSSEGMSGLTTTAENAKAHSESLTWIVEVTPILDALNKELQRLKSKAERSSGFSISWFWHTNYKDKVIKIERAIKNLKQKEAALTDELVITAIRDPSSEFYKALNQHTGHIFGGLFNGLTVTKHIVSRETQTILNMKAAISVENSYGPNKRHS